MSPLVERCADFLRRLTPLERGWAVSILLHGSLWLMFSWTHSVHMTDEALSVLEIDLTRPFRITDDPTKARRAENPGAGAPVVHKITPVAGKGVIGGSEEVPAPDARGPAKEWVLPTDATKELEEPSAGEAAGRPDGAGEGAGLGGLGGEGDGEVDVIYLTELPRLLNAGQLKRDVLRYYPPAQRSAGVEGWVRLTVHITPEGRVGRASILESSDPAFEEAARKVASRARYSPPKQGDRAVGAAMIFPLQFHLE